MHIQIVYFVLLGIDGGFKVQLLLLSRGCAYVRLGARCS